MWLAGGLSHSQRLWVYWFTIAEIALNTSASLFGLVDDVGGIREEVGQGLLLAPGPDDEQLVDLGGCSEADGEGELGLGQVTPGGHDLAGERGFADAGVDVGTDGVRIIGGPDEFDAEPVVVEALVISEDEGGSVNLGEDDIEVAVEVEVGISGSTADDGGEEVCAGFVAGDGEEAGGWRSAVGVPEQLCGLFVALVWGDLFDIGFDVAISCEEVQPAIKVIVEEEDAESKGHLAGGADALGEGFVREESGLVTGDVDGCHFVGEVADGDSEGVILVEVGGVDAHGTAGSSEGIEGDAGGGADIAECAVLLVAEHEILDRVIGDDEVEPAIVIDVDRADTEGFGEGQVCGAITELDTAGFGAVGERSVAVIAVEVGEGGREVPWLTVGSADAGQLVIGGVIYFAGPAEVVAHEEVEVAVVVHIEPGGGGAPVVGVAGYSGAGGDVGEPAIAEVLQEVIGAGGGDEHICEAVVVVIAGGDAHAVAGEVES